MSQKLPLHFNNYKGKIFKAISIDGARTWDDILNFTGLSADILNKVLSEMYDRNLIKKNQNKEYRIPPEIYYEYQNYYDQLEKSEKLHNEELSRIVDEVSSRVLTELDNKNDEIPINHVQDKDEEFLQLIQQKLEEMDFKFIQFLEKGGSAKIYLVYNAPLDNICILKVYMQTIEEIRNKYSKYDKIIRGIDHPNVNKILSSGEWKFQGKKYRWSIQEYFFPKSKSLDKIPHTLIKGREFKVRINLLKQLIQGMIVIRDQYNTHNDLHPGNILISENNEILKIIDPGFSKAEPGRDDTDLEDVKKIIQKYFFARKEQQAELFHGIIESKTFREISTLIENEFTDRLGSNFFQEIFDEINDIIAKIYFHAGTINPQTNLFTGLDSSQYIVFGISVAPSRRVFYFFSNLYSLHLTHLFDPEKVANQQQIAPLRINKDGIPNNITNSKQIIVFLRKLAKDFSRRSSQPIEFAEEKFPTEREIARKLLKDFIQALKDYQPKTLTKIYSHPFKKYYFCEYLQLKYSTGDDQIWNLWELNILHYHLGWDQNRLKMSNIETEQIYSEEEIPIEWIDEVVNYLLEKSDWFHSE